MTDDAGLLVPEPELARLTGYSQPARQCAWLASRGWVFEAPARRGDHPKVAQAYYDARMSGQRPQPERQRPSIDWMTA